MRLSDPGAWARAVFFALLPPVAAGGALGIPVLFSAAGIFQIRPRLIARTAARPPLWLITLTLFSAWAAASNLWAPPAAAEQTLKLAALLIFGLMFVAASGAPETRALTQACGIAAFFVILALLGIEALFDMPLMRAAQPGVDPGRLAATLTRGGTVLLALTWGAAASLIARDRPHAARLGLLASGVMALQFDQSAAVLAFVVGVVVFFLTPRAPRIALFAITCGLAAWVLAAPFATPLLLSDQRLIDGLPASWQERASIWRFACEQILREPWLGYGIDSARAAGERIPLHPHSASIQLWYETGAIGALLAAATLIAAGFALVRAFAQDRIAAAAAAATFASLGIVANISYGAWQEWWVATVFVAAALVAAAPEALKRSVDFSLDPATTPQP